MKKFKDRLFKMTLSNNCFVAGDCLVMENTNPNKNQNIIVLDNYKDFEYNCYLLKYNYKLKLLRKLNYLIIRLRYKYGKQ